MIKLLLLLFFLRVLWWRLIVYLYDQTKVKNWTIRDFIFIRILSFLEKNHIWYFYIYEMYNHLLSIEGFFRFLGSRYFIFIYFIFQPFQDYYWSSAKRRSDCLPGKRFFLEKKFNWFQFILVVCMLIWYMFRPLIWTLKSRYWLLWINLIRWPFSKFVFISIFIPMWILVLQVFFNLGFITLNFILLIISWIFISNIIYQYSVYFFSLISLIRSRHNLSGSNRSPWLFVYMEMEGLYTFQSVNMVDLRVADRDSGLVEVLLCDGTLRGVFFTWVNQNFQDRFSIIERRLALYIDNLSPKPLWWVLMWRLPELVVDEGCVFIDPLGYLYKEPLGSRELDILYEPVKFLRVFSINNFWQYTGPDWIDPPGLSDYGDFRYSRLAINGISPYYDARIALCYSLRYTYTQTLWVLAEYPGWNYIDNYLDFYDLKYSNELFMGPHCDRLKGQSFFFRYLKKKFGFYVDKIKSYFF